VTGKITKGDIELLSYITECKFLTVKQLVALSQRSIQVICRRLRFFNKEQFVVMNERGFGKGPGHRKNIIVLTEYGLQGSQQQSEEY
jgi:hypothetical protein